MEQIPEHLHFYRYEFKYLLSGEYTGIVTRTLDRHLDRDTHCDTTGDYPIRSVYFDSPSMRWFQEKKNGLMKRYKFRLRVYSRDMRGYLGPTYLELKGRNGSLVVKHRVKLDQEKFLLGIPRGTAGLKAMLFQDFAENTVARNFVAHSLRYNLSPSVITDYQRSAWESRANPDFRATIDSDTRAYRSCLNGLPAGYSQEITGNRCIVEVKFRYRIPFWFQRLVRDLNMQRISFSKFQMAVESVYMNHNSAILNRLVERSRACLN